MGEGNLPIFKYMLKVIGRETTVEKWQLRIDRPVLEAVYKLIGNTSYASRQMSQKLNGVESRLVGEFHEYLTSELKRLGEKFE